MTYRFPIRVGDRVALAPHTDLWMAGCRFGTVTSKSQDFVSGRFYFVDLDTGRNVTLNESDLLGAVGASPSTEEFDTEAVREKLRSIENTIASMFEASDRFFGAMAAEMAAAYEALGPVEPDDEETCAHEDCGYGDCSWLQEGPVEGMCQTHGNGEGRCQRDWCPVDGVECAEGGHRNDDNPGRPICATCDDDPNVSALYPR